VASAEDAVVTKDFLAEAVRRNGCDPHTIHAGHGGAMVSKPVSEPLVDLGVLRSHSRPRTSNDNPYSEAQFKTMKLCAGSWEDARTFCEGFFLAYNHEHRHSGIGMHTRRRCTSAPPSRSRPSGTPPWTGLTPPTLSVSLVALGPETARGGLAQPAR
jgi:transposase InsO family protein